MTNQSLIKITQDVIALEELILENNGELTDTLEQWMQINTENMAQKVDSYVYFIDRLENGIEFFKQKEDEIKKAREIYKSQIERLKNYLKLSMSYMATNELKGEMYRFKLVKSKPKIIIQDESLLPMIYMREKITHEPNKDLLKEVLDSGEKIEGVHLEESTSIRKFINREG